MNKREIKKAAYRAIVKENKSHQEVFDELRKSSTLELETLAEEVAKIPSAAKQNSQQLLRTIFIGMLAVIIILRIFAGAFTFSELNPAILLIALVLGIFVPAVGIFGALTSRVDTYRFVGMLLILSVVRSFSSEQMSAEPIEFLVFIPFVVAVALAFYIPTKLKTNYTKKVIKEEVDSKVKSRLQFIFDTSKVHADNELIDAGVI